MRIEELNEGNSGFSAAYEIENIVREENGFESEKRMRAKIS